MVPLFRHQQRHRSAAQRPQLRLPAFSHPPPPSPPSPPSPLPPIPPSDHIRGSIEERGALVFWLQWLFVPHYPLYRIASRAFDSHTYYDDIIQLVYAVGVIVDVALAVLHLGGLRTLYAKILCSMRIGLEASDLQFIGQLAILALTLAWALLCYHVMWRVLPLRLNDALFDVQVSVVIPFMILGSFYFSHVIAARYWKWATPQKKYW